MKKYTDLSDQEKQYFEDNFFITEPREDILIDQYNRPYVKTDKGLLYFSMKEGYKEYSFKNK